MMTTAMFHVKHRPVEEANRGKQGSGRGKRGSGRGLARASGPLYRGVTSSVIALAVIAVAACSPPDEIARNAPLAPTQTATAPTPPSPPTPPASAPGQSDFSSKATRGEAVRDFAYTWPAEVSAVPALAQRFAAERDALLAEQQTEWDAALREFAGQDCLACVNRDFQKTWNVVADLPRFLSLAASFYAYSGGAHGNSAYDALVWDREAKAAFDPKAMFVSPAALQNALGEGWCRALKVERIERLGQDYGDDSIFACPPIADLTVLVDSSDKRSFDSIGLLAAPYVAGSYAEGMYEVTLPVTPAVIAAVKPEYRAVFALGK